MVTRGALIAVAAVSAFLGTYAVGQADQEPAPVKRAVPAGAAVPAARAVPVPAAAQLPRLRARPQRAAPRPRRAVGRVRSVRAAPAPAPKPKPKPDRGTPFFDAN